MFDFQKEIYLGKKYTYFLYFFNNPPHPPAFSCSTLTNHLSSHQLATFKLARELIDTMYQTAVPRRKKTFVFATGQPSEKLELEGKNEKVNFFQATFSDKLFQQKFSLFSLRLILSILPLSLSSISIIELTENPTIILQRNSYKFLVWISK